MLIPCGLGGCRRALGAAVLTATVLLSAPPAGAEGPAPPILTRESWGAKAPLPGLVPHKLIGIIVHHTGVRQNTRASFPVKLRNLQSYSQRVTEFAPGQRKPAWPDLPYHFYIDASGAVAEGRDIRFAGSTNTNYNPAGYVQVVLEGNFEVEQPTAKQLESLKQVLRWQSLTHGVPIDKISIHRQHASTICPGKNLAAAMPGLLATIKNEGG